MKLSISPLPPSSLLLPIVAFFCSSLFLVNNAYADNAVVSKFFKASINTGLKTTVSSAYGNCESDKFKFPQKDEYNRTSRGKQRICKCRKEPCDSLAKFDSALLGKLEVLGIHDIRSAHLESLQVSSPDKSDKSVLRLEGNFHIGSLSAEIDWSRHKRVVSCKFDGAVNLSFKVDVDVTNTDEPQAKIKTFDLDNRLVCESPKKIFRLFRKTPNLSGLAEFVGQKVIKKITQDLLDSKHMVVLLVSFVQKWCAFSSSVSSFCAIS